jgi:hypothetical protein
VVCNELALSYARAEQRARQLGWQELAASKPDPQDESDQDESDQNEADQDAAP